eukprot:m.339530 g.339530  ORF g.339530 m.339530 type:complete len:217 (-) comp27817_c2_seq17:1308-1958(-)
MSTQQGSQRRVEQSKVRSPSRGRSTRTCSGAATQWTHLLFLAMHLKALDVPPLYVMLLDDDDTLVPDVIKINLTTAASQAGDFRLRNNTDYSGTFMPFDLFWRDMLQFIKEGHDPTDCMCFSVRCTHQRGPVGVIYCKDTDEIWSTPGTTGYRGGTGGSGKCICHCGRLARRLGSRRRRPRRESRAPPWLDAAPTPSLPQGPSRGTRLRAAQRVRA